MKIKNTESSLNLREPLWSVVSALAVVALLGVVLPVFAQQGYEAAPVLSASKILPPELLSGPNHRFQERVPNDGFMNTYRVDSKFGSLTAVSTAQLRKRIVEINAMVVMDKLKGTKEYADAIKDSALSTMVAAKDLVVQPVKTVSEVVSGVGIMFHRAGDSLFGAKRSDAEDSRFKDLIGFSSYKQR